MKNLALLLVGAWIAGTLIMFFVATEIFRTVDRILESPTPEAAPYLATPPGAAVSPAVQNSAMPKGARGVRPLLRHLSSELNRHYFYSWGLAQIALGAAT